ncbi:MAG: DUF192 domain-containing protein [Archaeoglobaceae archaeon]
MNWKVSVIVLLCVIVAAGFLFSQQLKGDRVCFKEHCFNVELAVTEEEQQKGLMFRESLGPDEGMLFVFEKEEYHSFWMKNTSIPLDIIWINEDREVVYISENTPPCEGNVCPIIEPDQKAKFVLEVKGGMVNRIGLKVGDKLEFDIGV